jgi:hypothetical protein
MAPRQIFLFTYATTANFFMENPRQKVGLVLNFIKYTHFTLRMLNLYEGVSKRFRTESITKYRLTTINTRREATLRVMAAKLTELTHKNSDTIAPNGKELYHLQFSLQAASPETSGYNLVQ